MTIRKYILPIILIGILIALNSTEILAQCPMCRMAAESNLKNGGSAGKGLNAAILYMLVVPYLVVGTIGFIWWKNHKRQ